MGNPHSLRIDEAVRERSLKAGLRQAVFWSVMFGAGESYFSLFAVHLDAPQFFFGLLVGIPSLLGPLTQAVGANVLEHVRSRKRLVLYSTGLQLLCFVPLATAPYFISGRPMHAVLLVFVAAYYATAQFGAPSWNSLIGVLVPSGRRTEYFARLSRDVAAVSLAVKMAVCAALFLAGRELALNPRSTSVGWVFTGAFIVAGVARFCSFRQIAKIYDPPLDHTPEDSFTFWQFLRRVRESNFVKFVIFVAVIQFAAQLAGPYFVPYFMYTLRFAQWQWVVVDAAAVLAAILTLLFWGRFSARFGNKKTLKYTTIGVGVVPLLWLLTTNFYLLIAVNAVAGAMWAGFNLSTFNYILEAASPAKRARCVAYFSLIVGVGIFSGSMLGGWLNETLPRTIHLGGWSATVQSNFTYLLLLTGLLRLSAALFFYPAFRELRDEVEPFSLRRWVAYNAEIWLPVRLRFGGNGEDEEEEEERGEPEEPPSE